MSQTFQPDYASPPGETLAETLDAMGLRQSELARLTFSLTTEHRLLSL